MKADYYSLSQIDDEMRSAMITLFRQYFDSVEDRVFYKDLEAKDGAILMKNGSDTLVGFSTVKILDFEWHGEVIKILYSGDTIVEATSRYTSVLGSAFLQVVESLIVDSPGKRCFWLLICSGFRTYRLMPLFWKYFLPNHCQQPHTDDVEMLHSLAGKEFGRQFDAEKGLVYLTSPQVLLPEIAAIPPGRENNPHIAYFLERNPGFPRGDELVCLAPMTRANQTAVGLRLHRLPEGKTYKVKDVQSGFQRWMLGCRSDFDQFKGALGQLRDSQEKILFSMLESNKNTAFGQEYGFEKIKSLEDFQARIPLSRYEDYTTWIDRLSNGESDILTAEPVTQFIPSSGSTSAIKYIPCNETLLGQFRSAINPWLFSMYQSQPELTLGRAYWSITPAIGSMPSCKGQIPVGFDTDAAYLSGKARNELENILAVPGWVSQIGNYENFVFITLFYLLSADDLTHISIWHPSFLQLLLSRMEKYRESLICSLMEGKLHIPEKRESGLLHFIEKLSIERNSTRSHELRRLGSLAPECWKYLWPDLKMISCWTDGPSKRAARQLQELFPDSNVLGKGLLATEGVISIPFEGNRLLACQSHFFEFLDKEGICHPPWETQWGNEYQIILTTGGGLYRYLLGDRVQVTGFTQSVPHITFLGKEDQVSDFYGEKLNERFVASVLEKLFNHHGIHPEFAILAPDTDNGRVQAYTLYLQISRVKSLEKIKYSLTETLENFLTQNPNYAYCRRLGQLKEVRLFNVTSDAYSDFLERINQTGRRLGDIKPTTLSSMAGWSDCFSGHYEQEQREVCND